MKVGAIVLKDEFVVHGAVFRLPGLTATLPCLHASHSEGSTDTTRSVARAVRGTLTSTLPPERSIIEAAAMTLAPALLSASIVSRVEPPVVITSSTTNVFSFGVTV